MNHKETELHGDASERCLRKSAEKYNNKCISTTVKHGGSGAIVWGAFLAAGELLHCEKSFTALEYRTILQNGLLPTNEKLLSKEK